MKVESFKIKVNPRQSGIIQKRLFELGIYWQDYEKRHEILHHDRPYLYVYSENYINYGKSEHYFIEHPYKELTFEQFKEKYMEFEVPKKWCIKACKELNEYGKSRSNVDGNYQNYYYWWDLKSLTSEGREKWNYLQWLPMGYTEITFEQFEKHILNKKEEMNEPKTFKITGRLLLLKAMWEDLVDAGWTASRFAPTYSEDGDIVTNHFIHSNLEKISKDSFEIIVYNKSAKKHDKTFNLPEQYNEALEFAKQQLNHPYWKERDKNKPPDIKIGGYLADFSKKGYVKFGCMKFDLKFIEKFHQIIENVNSREINVGDLDEIIEYLKKNK